MSEDVLGRLAATIQQRRSEDPGRSYTRQLLDAGPARCARKLVEEALETLIAGISQDDQALTSEAADLVYHLLVLLASRGVSWSRVLAELDRRTGTSGLAEKAARSGQGNVS